MVIYFERLRMLVRLAQRVGLLGSAIGAKGFISWEDVGAVFALASGVLSLECLTDAIGTLHVVRYMVAADDHWLAVSSFPF
jgi:hypothetical protein